MLADAKTPAVVQQSLEEKENVEEGKDARGTKRPPESGADGEKKSKWLKITKVSSPTPKKNQLWWIVKPDIKLSKSKNYCMASL